jgi:hypothetical protein
MVVGVERKIACSFVWHDRNKVVTDHAKTVRQGKSSSDYGIPTMLDAACFFS